MGERKREEGEGGEGWGRVEGSSWQVGKVERARLRGNQEPEARGQSGAQDVEEDAGPRREETQRGQMEHSGRIEKGSGGAGGKKREGM